MTELKVGMRGTWGATQLPCVVVVPEPDSTGCIVVGTLRDRELRHYVVIPPEDFTPEPNPPTTVMVEMDVDDAKRWSGAAADIRRDSLRRQRLAEAAKKALKEAGL